MKHRGKKLVVTRFLGQVALIGAALLAPLFAKAATPDSFQARTTADMVTLCNADSSSSDYAMAVSFCQGFAVGAYQYYAVVATASPTSRYVCLPNPPPTRSQAIADFVAWTKNHPDTLSSLPVDSMFRYLGERYPCRR